MNIINLEDSRKLSDKEADKFFAAHIDNYTPEFKENEKYKNVANKTPSKILSVEDVRNNNF